MTEWRTRQKAGEHLDDMPVIGRTSAYSQQGHRVRFGGPCKTARDKMRAERGGPAGRI